MSNKVKNAKAIYMEGIRDGNFEEAVHKYTGDQYVQHSTGVKTGKEGFIEFFSDFVKRCPIRDIQIVRSWEDGQYVFVQAYQNINNGESEWVTTDFFDTDSNDKLIEHWDVISAFNANTPSGHTSIDGATEIEDLELTDSNKQLVQNFIKNVMMKDGDITKAGQYISGSEYIQHNKEVPDGLESFKKMLLAEDRALFYDEIVLCVGSGNFVATLCKTHINEDDYAQVDIFRIKEGLIVEHWDNVEPVPEFQVNSGKF